MPKTANTTDHRGTRALQQLVEYAPSTGGLALWIHHRDEESALSAPPIATDGQTIFYRNAFDALPLAEQTGLVAHEVLHLALRHPQRFLALNTLVGGADLQLFTICADAIVNSTLSHLAWLKLPEKSIFLETLLASTLGIGRLVENALIEWDVERLYRELDDRGPEQFVVRRYGKLVAVRSEDLSGAKPGRSGSARGDDSQKNFVLDADTPEKQNSGDDQPQIHRDDGPLAAQTRELGKSSRADILPDPQRREAPELEAAAAREWSERLARGHANDGAFSMLRVLVADLPRSHTPWEQILRTRLARSLSRKADLSWSRPARSYIANRGRTSGGQRLPFEPGTIATKSVPRLALIVDISGSIDTKLTSRFATEIENIVRRQDSSLTLIIGDDQVRDVRHFSPGKTKLEKLDCLGGGGTDFTPLIEEAMLHDPDIAVVLTDLDGPARTKPRFPVIWAVPKADAAAVAPFGQKLVLR